MTGNITSLRNRTGDIATQIGIALDNEMFATLDEFEQTGLILDMLGNEMEYLRGMVRGAAGDFNDTSTLREAIGEVTGKALVTRLAVTTIAQRVYGEERVAQEQVDKARLYDEERPALQRIQELSGRKNLEEITAFFEEVLCIKQERERQEDAQGEHVASLQELMGGLYHAITGEQWQIVDEESVRRNVYGAQQALAVLRTELEDGKRRLEKAHELNGDLERKSSAAEKERSEAERQLMRVAAAVAPLYNALTSPEGYITVELVDKTPVNFIEAIARKYGEIVANTRQEKEAAEKKVGQADSARANVEDRLSNLATAIGAVYDRLYDGVEGKLDAAPDTVKAKTLSFFNAVVGRYDKLLGDKEKQTASLQKWLGHIYYAVTNKELPSLSNEDTQKTMGALEEALHIFEKDLLRAKEEAEEIQRTKRELSGTVEQLTKALKRPVDKQITVKQAASSLDDHLALKRAYAQSLVENVVDNHLVSGMGAFERNVQDMSEFDIYFEKQKRLIRCAQAYARGNFEEARKESPFKDAIQLTHGYENEDYGMMYLQALALWNVWNRKEESEERARKIKYAHILRSKAREYQGIAPIDEIMHDIMHEALPADDSDPPVRTAEKLHQSFDKITKEKGADYTLLNNAMVYLMDPNHKWAAYDLSACYDQLGKETEASVFLDIAEEVMKHHENRQGLSWVYQRRGRMYQQKEEPQKAAVAYTQSLEANPGNEASKQGLHTVVEKIVKENEALFEADPLYTENAPEVERHTLGTLKNAAPYLDEPLKGRTEKMFPLLRRFVD